MASPRQPKQAANDNSQTRTAPEGMDFVRNNKIHIQHGSKFVDGYLVLHPRELDPSKPEREQAALAKLTHTFGMHTPSFYDSPARAVIGGALAELVDPGLAAKREEQLRAVNAYNDEVKTGVTDLHRAAEDRKNPFAALVRDSSYRHQPGPLDKQTQKNGLALYLIVREALTRKNYLNRMPSYFLKHLTAGAMEQDIALSSGHVLQSLKSLLGVAPEAVEEAALKEGVNGVAKLLGIEPAYVNEVNELVNYVAEREFSYSMVEHWHIGRQLLRAQTRPVSLEEKLKVGMERRIQDTLGELRLKCKGQYDVPENIQKQERWVAEQMEVLHPVQRQLLADLNYEICYTDQPVADSIAFYSHIYGLHRNTRNDPKDISGVYRVYFSGKGRQARATLAHEVTHNLWPALFSPKEVAEIDRNVQQDNLRIRTIAGQFEKDFPTFKAYLDAYHAAETPEEQSQVLAKANQHFASTLGPLDALFAEQKDAYRVKDMVEYADNELRIGGAVYRMSGHYTTADYQMREIISRFGALDMVHTPKDPALVKFIAPGLDHVFHDYYLPHLERLHQQIVAGKQVVEVLPKIHVQVDATPPQDPIPQPNNTLIPKNDPPPVRKEAALTATDAHRPTAQVHGASCPCCGPGKSATRTAAALKHDVLSVQVNSVQM
jgi:hypothetical protein